MRKRVLQPYNSEAPPRAMPALRGEAPAHHDCPGAAKPRGRAARASWPFSPPPPLPAAVCVVAIACIAAVPLAAVPAEAQSYTAVLRLDPVPPQIRTGDAVVFSGKLTTTSNHVVPGATVYIKDDVSFGRDTVIGKAFTDDRGEFRVAWTAKPRSSGEWDFYATYGGSQRVSEARSSTYGVDVSSRHSGASGGAPANSIRDYSTILTLDRIQDTAWVGDRVTFTGRLTSGDGPVSNAVVRIMEDDPFVKDERLAWGRTDGTGRFSIPWKAAAADLETEFDVYALFTGSSSYERSRTANQEMDVVKRGGSLTLDRIQDAAWVGDRVTFTGKLTSGGWPVSNAVVRIMEDDPLDKDERLAWGRTDGTGRFSIPWKAAAADLETEFDVYALFTGSSSYERSRTANQEMYVVKRGGSLTLDKIPDAAWVGDRVTFTGKLTSGGWPVSNAVVRIMEDDPLAKDERLAWGRTDGTGRFSIPWKAAAADLETEFDVYALFTGSSSYERSRTANQEMYVVKRGGSLTLDRIPDTAKVGDRVTFSGTLRLHDSPAKGSIVYIKDEDDLRRDDLLATAYVNQYGRFSTTWTAVPVDPLYGAGEIFAVFEGDSTHKRLTTKQQTIGIAEARKAPAAAPGDDVYMEIYWNKQFRSPPHVAITPHPDEVDDVKKYMGAVQEGLQMWSIRMAAQHGGDWAVTSEIVRPGDKFSREPDISMNLVTYQSAYGIHGEEGCADWAGLAYGVNRREPPEGAVSTIVCTQVQKTDRSHEDVVATAAHEFIHAMGVGHTFGNVADMMCSVENDMQTCDYRGNKPNAPSRLNMDAVAALYGADGFQYPNNGVAYKQKVFAGGSGSGGDAGRNPAASSPCAGDDHSYDFKVNQALEPGQYVWWTLCTPDISYGLSTDSEYGNSSRF